MNGGNEWLSQQNPTTNNLWAVYFVNETTGWAAGWNGTILHTRTGGSTSVGENEKPVDFVLHQNYPNPFNPSTTIRFQIGEVEGQKSEVSHVMLKVFDLLGGEVATLVNDEMQPGSYEKTFSGNGLASGVYLYQLSAGSFVQTRKLLLLR